ncbi:MAG: histidinol dehydrogenase [Bdellovibrionaceae bacterium]|jgi:histidinol dehydrogenase|nr:histidinol dehydrogenase [Pseudobdellovibrionaceae bacterium]
MQQLIWSELNEQEKLLALNRPGVSHSDSLTESVKSILLEVKKNKHKAVQQFTSKFDSVKLEDIRVSVQEFKEAEELVPENVVKSFELAIENIKKFHHAQKFSNIKLDVMPGIQCEQVARAIGKVGLYVPGGTAPLPSTVFMLAIPAEIAGCGKRVICTPPQSNGKIDANILMAAKMVGVTEIYKVGGAQAIAAMAYGTEIIPKVDKIFGPGNSWVTEAKVQVAQDPSAAVCDMPAGPSEVLVISDEQANPEFVATDLLSQAEHGVDSQVILLSTCKNHIAAVKTALMNFTEQLDRKSIIVESLKHSKMILVNSIDEALEVSELYAPEHLILQFQNADKYLNRINNAGSVFVGPWTPESVGDYASGTNHVLPTFGYAKNLSGLNLDSFCRKMTIQTLTPEGILAIGPTVETLAGIEGLNAHKLAVTVRLKQLNKKGDN